MKIIYLAAGLLALALGAVGVALPILPSTPFLLIAAFCFARSSQRLNTWFKGTKLYKKNLETFVRGQGMTRATKLRIITSVTVIMAIAFFFMRGTNIGRICLAVVWAAHIIALCFFVKTCPREAAGDGAAVCSGVIEGYAAVGNASIGGAAKGCEAPSKTVSAPHVGGAADLESAFSGGADDLDAVFSAGAGIPAAEKMEE